MGEPVPIRSSRPLHDDGSPLAQSTRGGWVPAIPLPLYVFRGVRCECGRRFRHAEAYRGHYALVHVLGLL